MNEGAREANDWNWRRSVLEELRTISAALAPKKAEHEQPSKPIPVRYILHSDGTWHKVFDECDKTYPERTNVIFVHDERACDAVRTR